MQTQQMALHQRRGRAVMVEDDPDVVACATLAAGSLPMDVFSTRDEALAALASAHELPAVILLDLDLPDGHGFDILDQLRAKPATRHLPVVVFTATDADPAEGYRRGANAWVEKPCSGDDLERAIRDILAFWLGHNAVAKS